MALDLEAIELIKQLKARYFRFLDTRNIEGLHSVGHEVGHSGLAEWCTAEAVCGAS